MKKKIPTFETVINPNAPAAIAKIAALNAEREQLAATEVATRAALAVAKERETTSNNQRAQLFRVCEGMPSTTPSVEAPHEELGKAVLAASKAANELRAAEAAAEAAAARKVERGAEIDREIATIELTLRKGRLHALVAEYDRRVQTAELGWLSDEIRKAAGAVSMRPEPDCPLMTEGRLTVCGYPLQPWG